jgi:hypothetical protein
VTIKKLNAALIILILFSALSINRSYAEVSVGDSYGGGTIFCVSKTPDIKQCVIQGSGNYGLIMANEDQVNFDSNSKHGITWAAEYKSAGALSSDDDGLANTAAIIKAHPKDNSSNNAAWLAYDYNKVHGQDAGQNLTIWYLPAKNELHKMYLYAKANNLIGRNCAGRKAGGVQCLIGGYSVKENGDSKYKIYWSSTEYSGDNYSAWSQNFDTGLQDDLYKINSYVGVHAVRAFNNSTIQQFNNLPKPKTPQNVPVATVAKKPLPDVKIHPHVYATPPTAATAHTNANRFTFGNVGDKLARNMGAVVTLGSLQTALPVLPAQHLVVG